MFEARLVQGAILKKVVDAVKDLVTDANFDVSSTGISLQAMDSSHVCLVALEMKAEGFDPFRCDRAMSMGIHLANLAKILKCAGNDDVISMRAQDEADTLTMMFESEKQDRVSDFDLKLMSIESEHLGIPEQEYSAQVLMPANEFQRIVRDLSTIGDTVLITATKEGIKFSTQGDVGTANIMCRHNNSAEDDSQNTNITLNEPVSLTFALRYLNNFTKATPLAARVKLGLTKDLPIVVEYQIEQLGKLAYYLAPKIEDEEMAAEEEAQS